MIASPTTYAARFIVRRTKRAAPKSGMLRSGTITESFSCCPITIRAAMSFFILRNIDPPKP